MTPNEFSRYLIEAQREIQQYINEDAPVIIGKTAVDHFTENFQQEGFVDGGVQKWQEVKRRMNPKITGARASRPILTGDTGDLGMSIQYKDAADGKVTVYSDLPYSEAHNEGTANAGRSHNVVIPKRQFIGESEELNEKIKEELERKIGGKLK
jgi:phage gpG-like protein